MKAFVLVLVLFGALPLRAAIISSIERLDSAVPPATLLFHSSLSFLPGFPVWSNTSFQFRSVPSYLIGADQVRTAYFTDSSDPDYQLRLTLAVPATVYLIIDDRAPDVATAMPWVAALGFTDTGDDAVIQVSADQVLTTASIYGGSFPAGNVILLQQNDVPNHSGMFTVAAVPEPASSSLFLCGVVFCYRRRSLRANDRVA